MADLSDVVNGLVALIGTTVYPNGTAQPSITGSPVIVHGGWPLEDQLIADLAGSPSKAHVSVWPTPAEKVLPLTLFQWVTNSITAPTLTATIAGKTVSIGGTVTVPCNVALLVGNVAYPYAVRSQDTLATIATALAALVPGATASGAVVTLPANANIQGARVGMNGSAYMVVRRQEKVFQITIWANCFDARDLLSAAIDPVLAGTIRMQLSDGSFGILRYKSSIQNDSQQKQGLYRRDLMYAVEFETMQNQTQTQITQGELNAGNQLDGSTVGNATITLYS